jgi:site-specific DNA-cytosine methylase
MQRLRAELEDLTGHEYQLTHAFHSACSLPGGNALRKRYYFVASRVPFGIEPFDLVWPHTIRELIQDLEHKPLQWEADAGQPDGHQVSPSLHSGRIARYLEKYNDYWTPELNMGEAVKATIADGNSLPEDFYGPDGEPINQVVASSFYAPHRWKADVLPRVMTGSFWQDVAHPWLPRTLTLREGARFMDYPDDWKLTPGQGKGAAGSWLGKGVCVSTGRWIGTWARRALEGEPGGWFGEKIGDREYSVDVTNDYKMVIGDDGVRRDARSADLKRRMATRIEQRSL